MPDFGLVKVLICPDSFTGTLSAAEAAAAMAEGWASVAPGDDLVLRPLSDGGPGFLDAIGAGRGGVRHPCRSPGPLGSPVEADYLMTDDGTAWIESATAAGLHLVPDDRRDPTRTTSRGVGELMAAALAGGRTADRGRGRRDRDLRWGSGAPGGPGCHVASPRAGCPAAARRWPTLRGGRPRPRPGGRRRVRARGRHRRRRARCSGPAGRPGGSPPRRAPPRSRSSSSRRR